jgi:hypothetical protein
MTVFASGGKARTFDYLAGDVGYVPFAMGHYVENTGTDTLRFDAAEGQAGHRGAPRGAPRGPSLNCSISAALEILAEQESSRLGRIAEGNQ